MQTKVKMPVRYMPSLMEDKANNLVLLLDQKMHKRFFEQELKQGMHQTAHFINNRVKKSNQESIKENQSNLF